MSNENGPDPATLIDLFCRKSRAVKSKASRGGKKELSIAAQEATGRRVAALLNLTVRHVWKEVGSASRFRTKGRRDDQDKALAALEAGEVGALWCFRLDRWDRRGAGAILRIIEPGDEKPRRLLFGWDENAGRWELDSTNPRDRGELIRRAEDAREETERLSERVRNTKEHQRSNGEWVNARAPYGLEVVLVEKFDEEGDPYDERKLRVSHAPANEPQGRTTSEIAWHVFDLIETKGLSIRATVRQLDAEAIPSPSGGTWAWGTVRDMLWNAAYSGWQVTGRQEGGRKRLAYRDETGQKVSIMTGPPLVEEKKQLAAQVAVTGVRTGPEGEPHELSTRIRCEGCEGAMVTAGRGYQCSRHHMGAFCPAPAYVQRNVIEKYVAERWKIRLNSSEPGEPLVVEAARRWKAAEKPQETEEEEEARRSLVNAEKALQRVWADRKAGLYDGPSEEYFAPALRDANALVTACRAVLDKMRGTAAVDVSFLMDPLQAPEAWDAAGTPMRRTLIGLAIDEVWVSKAAFEGQRFNGEERVTINWAGESPNRPRKHKPAA
jgi:DNA invertase Pin-like site-specific DNA recombinase